MKAIDLFAGFGGMSSGAEQAGARVVWAANHWELAVTVHRANHPRTEHACQDLRQADWASVPVRRRDFLLLAAPACQGHSEAAQPARAARGDIRHRHDALRSTAWAVIDCADALEPQALIVENVPEFREWRLFPEWRAALERIGFRLTEQIIVAADHGVPQLRERLFLVGTRRAFAMPLTTQGRPAFGPCVQWGEGAWRPTSTASPGARERIAAAQARLGARCLVQHTSGHRGVPLHEPIRTVTTKDQWIVVDGSRYRPLTLREYARAMGFPESYALPADASRSDVVKGLGNAVAPPVARDLVRAVLEAA